MNELDQEKLFYERFNALHGDEQLLSIFQKFGIEVFRRSSALEGLDRILREKGIRGRHAVEIGTCHGITSIILSRYFDKVTTFDIFPSDYKREIAKYVVADNIEFVDVKDNKEKERIVSGLDFDFAYQDGNHKDDTMTDFKMLEKCGHIIFHEYWAMQPSVVMLVDSLKGNISRYHKFALWRKYDKKSI